MVPDQPFEAAQGSAKPLPMRPAPSPSCSRRWTASAARSQQVVRVERVVVHEGGQAIIGNVKAGDTGAVTKPAPPLAIAQEQSGMTLEDLIGKQPELVGREGV